MRIAIIGGGLDMLTLPHALRKWSHIIDCYLVDRHANAIINGKSLLELLNDAQIPNFLVEDELDLQSKIGDKHYDLIFGLGPAWIISRKTLGLANLWININSIPLPRYMGGAHSTWQLLNEDDSGSIVFQEIDFPVDQGKILAKFDFSYTKEQASPEARLRENSRQLLLNLETAMIGIIEGKHDSTRFLDLSQAEYWPRLSTKIHGWVDWGWTSVEIVRFIAAFGEPYEGAKTELMGHVVYFRHAHMLEERTFHPFSAGTIVRHQPNGGIDVAVTDGIIRLNVLIPEALPRKSLKGLRFHTPIDKLEIAKTTNLFSTDM
jgi:methionyl-tRNA formyltransferase